LVFLFSLDVSVRTPDSGLAGSALLLELHALLLLSENMKGTRLQFLLPWFN